jgi:hypothetical protein
MREGQEGVRRSRRRRAFAVTELPLVGPLRSWTSALRSSRKFIRDTARSPTTSKGPGLDNNLSVVRHDRELMLDHGAHHPCGDGSVYGVDRGDANAHEHLVGGDLCGVGTSRRAGLLSKPSSTMARIGSFS